jgi:SAM-dependent methyltransferase
MNIRKLDIGGGRGKQDGYIGIDILDYDGVDIVWNLENFPWPLEDNSFDYIKAFHIVEHINDMGAFFKEIHRIASNKAILSISTPHFSSRNSWIDPTHVKHLSLFFTDHFTREGSLSEGEVCFELVSRRVSFGHLIGSMRARFISKLFGYERWERNAFKMPAQNIYIDLKVIK